jgi:hypothetical protein
MTLAQDSSPRSVAAAKVVRDTASRAGLPVRAEPDPNSALLVVSGWADGYTAMTRAAEAQCLAPTYQYGLYLAPWLLNGPIVNAVSSSSLPLRFDPREQLAVSYSVAVGNGFRKPDRRRADFRFGTGERHADVFERTARRWNGDEPRLRRSMGAQRNHCSGEQLASVTNASARRCRAGRNSRERPGDDQMKKIAARVLIPLAAASALFGLAGPWPNRAGHAHLGDPRPRPRRVARPGNPGSDAASRAGVLPDHADLLTAKTHI